MVPGCVLAFETWAFRSLWKQRLPSPHPFSAEHHCAYETVNIPPRRTPQQLNRKTCFMSPERRNWGKVTPSTQSPVHREEPGKKKSHARKQWCTELSAPPLLRSSEDLQAQWQLESLVFLGFPNFPQRTSPLFSVWCEMINSLKRHRELRRSEDSFLCLLRDKMGKKHFVTPSGVCACLPVCYLPEYQLFIYYISPIIYLSSAYPLCIDHLFTCLSVIYLYYQLYIMYYISLSFD